MAYFLVIDQGNTRLKAGIFRDQRLIRKVTLEKASLKPLLRLIGKRTIEGILLSSVGRMPASLVKALRAIAPLKVFGPATPVPVINRYKTPETLGSDRLAAVVGAYSLYPNKNVLVIDAGTCIKYDFLHKTEGYLGGSIAPGISLRLKILHQATRKLPLIAPAEVKSFIGNDTRSSILTGCITAAALEAEGFVREYRKKYGSLQILLTGGDALRLSKQLNFSIFAAPDLVLTGLNAILRYALSSK